MEGHKFKKSGQMQRTKVGWMFGLEKKGISSKVGLIEGSRMLEELQANSVKPKAWESGKRL